MNHLPAAATTACRVLGAMVLLLLAFVSSPQVAAAGCDPGTYGMDCLPCPGGAATPCNSNGTCDEGPFGSGTCACDVGITGEACDQCAPDYYSYPTCTFCDQTITCSDNGQCGVSGTCECFAGYAGASCDQCGPNFYDYPNCTFCDDFISCSANGTCSGTGTCNCTTGYAGASCSQCAPGYSGYPACIPLATTTTSSTSTTTSTSTTMPDPDCPATVGVGCDLDLSSKLIIKNNDDDTRDVLIWKWLNGGAFSQADTLDPSMTTSYYLCIYDSTGAVQSLVGQAMIAPDTSWTSKDPKGWKYANAAGSDGITKILLKTGEAGETKMIVKGRGVDLPIPPAVSMTELFNQDAVVAVELLNSDTGQCWISIFPTAKKNVPTLFVGP